MSVAIFRLYPYWIFMSNINKSHSKLHTRLSFGVGRIAVNMFYTVFVRFASVNLCGLYCEGCSPDSPRDSELSPPLSYTKLKAFESLSSEKTYSATYTSCHTSSAGHAIFLFHGLRHNFLLLLLPEVEFQLKIPIFS